MALTLQAEPVEDMLSKFAQLSGGGISDLVRANARLAAVELANRTQPWTDKKDNKGADVLEKVSKTVTTDVKKVIKTKDDFETYLHGRIQDERIKKRLLEVARADRYDLLGKIMFNCGMITSEDGIKKLTGDSEHSETHKKYRSNTGRTSSPTDAKYISQGLLTYIQNVLKRIGYAKSGWAECARAIGGIKGDGARGIPAFAKRQRGNNFNFQKISAQQFEMTNSTPYIDRLCDSSAKSAAVDVASDNLTKSILKAFDAASKKESIMKEIIEQEINTTL